MVSAMQAVDLKGITYVQGNPRSLRADCKLGQFKIGADKIIGSELKLEILFYDRVTAALFKYPEQTWIHIIFVEKSRNLLCELMFKTESADNFMSYVLDLATERKILGHQITTAKMVQRHNSETNSKYFAVEFSGEPNLTKRIKELNQFVEVNDVYSSRLHKLCGSQRALPANSVQPGEVIEADDNEAGDDGGDGENGDIEI